MLTAVRPIDGNFWQWAYFLFVKYWPLFYNGIKFTLLIALSGTIFGLLIGLFVGGLRATKVNNTDTFLVKWQKKLIHLTSSIYIEVFRGTPMMVQAVFIYYSLKPLLLWSPLVAGIVIVAINTGAYMAEIVRAGIQSVPLGQSEAAMSLGMNSGQALLNIILPQAIRNAFPAIGNEFVVNLKDSSVLNVISVTEIYFQTASVAGTFYKTQEAFFVAALVYFVLTFSTTRVLTYIEKKLETTTKTWGSQTVPAAVFVQGGDHPSWR